MRLHPLVLSLLLLPALGACTSDDPSVENEAEQEAALVAAQQAAESAADVAPAEPPPAPECDASQVQGLVGQPIDDDKAEQARVDAGASSVRVITEGQMMTMEFDGSRLNIEIDAKDVIVAVRCG